MKHLKVIALLLAVPMLAVPAAPRGDDEDNAPTRFAAELKGPNETPAILSAATGTFRARLNDDSSLSFRLTYQGLKTKVLVAHIHIGQKNVAGGVTVFFCGGGGKPDCTSPDGDITGTIRAADINALPSQELAAGDFDKLISAMRRGLTYANVHTQAHGAGEVRGQIMARRDEDDDE